MTNLLESNSWSSYEDAGEIIRCRIADWMFGTGNDSLGSIYNPMVNSAYRRRDWQKTTQRTSTAGNRYDGSDMCTLVSISPSQSWVTVIFRNQSCLSSHKNQLKHTFDSFWIDQPRLFPWESILWLKESMNFFLGLILTNEELIYEPIMGKRLFNMARLGAKSKVREVLIRDVPSRWLCPDCIHRRITPTTRHSPIQRLHWFRTQQLCE